MGKFLLYILLLFWWCLIFPDTSYFYEKPCTDSHYNKYSLKINNKEIRFKFLDFFEYHD